MIHTKVSRAFSLMELLVAVSILAIIAAVIMMRYMGLQAQAQSTVEQQMAGELNHTYADWKVSGGQVIFPALTSDLLTVFSSPGGSTANNVTTGTAADAGQSSDVRAGNLNGFTAALSPVNGSFDGSFVQLGNMVIWFDNSSQMFNTYSSSQLAGAAWQGISGALLQYSSGNVNPHIVTFPLPDGSGNWAAFSIDRNNDPWLTPGASGIIVGSYHGNIYKIQVNDALGQNQTATVTMVSEGAVGSFPPLPNALW